MIAMKSFSLQNLLFATGFVCCVSPAAAHHSFAMFDAAKTVNYKGVVKEVDWANPHVWVKVLVEGNGPPKTLDFEAGAIPVLKREGWQRGDLKAGDRIEFSSHPYKSGKEGGSLERVTLPNGRTVNSGDNLPRALLPPS